MIQRARWVVGVAVLLCVLVAVGTLLVYADPTTTNTYDDGVVSHGAYGVWRMNDTAGCTATGGTYAAYLGSMVNAGSGANGGADQSAALTVGPNRAVFTDQGSCFAPDRAGRVGQYPIGGTFGGFGVWYRPAAQPSSGQNLIFQYGSNATEGFGVKLDAASLNWVALVAHNGGWISGGVQWQSTPLVVGQWYYFAVVQDQATNVLSFYLNGAFVVSIAAGTAYTGSGMNVAFNGVCDYFLCGGSAPGYYSEVWTARGSYGGGSMTSGAAIAQDYQTMTAGAGPPVDTFGNSGSPVTQRPSGIAPIVAQTCTGPTDWTQVQQYITWLACQTQNIMASVLNPVITVLNWGMNLVGWFFDFSRPLNTAPLSSLGATVRTRFPFSIPFDIAGILGTIFGATPTPPAFDLVVHEQTLGTDFHVVFNLSWMAPIMPLIRWGELAVFTVGLGLAYRKWSGGGW